MTTFRTPPIEVGHGYFVEFSFGEAMDCKWLPEMPPAAIGRKLLPAYKRARSQFIELIQERLGTRIMVIDL